MALKPCRECKSMVSGEAKTCPNCGIKNPIKKSAKWIWGALGIVVMFIVFSPKNDGANKKTLTPEEQASIDYQQACSKNYKACKNNSDIFNFNETVRAKSAASCQIAAEKYAVSEVDWGGFTQPNFSAFRPGDSGLKEDKIVVIDDVAKYTNQFGAKIKRETICLFNLKTNEVENILIQ